VVRPGHGAAFFRSNQHPSLFSWMPALRDARDDVLVGYTQAAARAIDGMQNSGWLAGLIESSAAQQVGTGLRLNAQPDADTLGWEQDYAYEWARKVERRFEAWASDPDECDAAARMSIGEMAEATVGCHFAFGEAVATLPERERKWAQTRTKVNLLPPLRLSQQTDPSRGLFQGVFTDRYGAPRGYLFELDNALGFREERIIPARDSDGRPMVLHCFKGMPGQVRGISPFAPVLRIVRQYDQLADATLTAAMLQTVFAATLKSTLGSKEAFEGLLDETEDLSEKQIENLMGLRNEWYDNTKIDLANNGRIAHLFPEDELEFHGSKHPNDSYESFSKGLIREIARCAGSTYEDASGDYTNATYSSVRMATSLVWGVVVARRKAIPARFCQGVFEVWLDEEIGEGRIEFPGGYQEFLANWSAATRATWRGPAKPQADDLKAAKAHDTWRKMGVVSDEMICSDLGVDVDDVYEQRAREKKRREELGLDEADTSPDPVGDALLTEESRA